MLESQLSSGEPLIPGDANYALSNYCKRLSTFTLPVALRQDSTCSKYEWTLEKTILKRLAEGARFSITKSPKPSQQSGFTMIGCMWCCACLNLPHSYFGCDGVYNPDVSKKLNFDTTKFWFSSEKELGGLLPGETKAGMCTAELAEPGCRFDRSDEHHV